MVGTLGITTITDALHLKVVDVTRLGGDVQIRLRPTRHTVATGAVRPDETSGGS
jgi:diaminohydroxyphosphoribosylaminopyrimidine deaminase/5-amino-6-(5-phosphoribosylamino)uracil reductase